MKRRGFITALGLAPVAANTKPARQLESGVALREVHEARGIAAWAATNEEVREFWGSDPNRSRR